MTKAAPTEDERDAVSFLSGDVLAGADALAKCKCHDNAIKLAVLKQKMNAAARELRRKFYIVS